MSVSDDPAALAPTGPGHEPVPVVFEGRNIWKIGFVVLAVVSVSAFLSFILNDGGATIFTLLMAWFASIAMAPAVDRLSRHMRRGVATLLIMGVFVLFLVLFIAAFGRLFVEQVAEIARALPDLVNATIAWVNDRFDQNLSVESVLQSLNLGSDQVQNLATQALGILASVLSGFFSLFTFGLFTFYLSADGPRFRNWVGSLFPAQAQDFAMNVWDITAAKTGGYVGARVLLAAINSATTAIVFVIIGMPYWLALAIWTGVVAQFVPTIGTYISIILPVIVGLTSGNPIVGVLALVWALIYQQVENLTIEPKISARAVDVHPAVAFAAVMMGAALFGVSGAFLAVPVTAMLLALLGIYGKRHELRPDLRSKSLAMDDVDKVLAAPSKAGGGAGGESAAAAEES